MLTHRNLVANMQQAAAWIGTNVQVRRGDHHHRAAAVPHLRVDGERPGLHEVRRPQPPDHQSARHARLRQGAEEGPVHRDHRRQHAVQRPAQHAGLRPRSISRACTSRWAAAWRCSAPWPNAGRRSPASTLVEAYGLTETSPAACINPMDLAEYNGSIGLPIPSTDACLKDDDGNVVPAWAKSASCASRARR